MRLHNRLRLGRFGRTVLAVASALALALPAVLLWSASRASAETTSVVDQFGTSGNEYPEAVITDASGNVYVAGQVGGTFPGQTTAGSGDAFVRKYNSAGTPQWTKQFGSTGDDEVMALAVDASGNVYAAGYAQGVLTDCTPACTGAGSTDAFVRQYTPSGSVGWTRQFGTTVEDGAYGVAVSSGHVYVAGYTYGALPGFTNPDQAESGFVRQYDTDGTEGWTREFTGTNSNNVSTWYSNILVSGVAVDGSGNVYLSGQADGILDDCSPVACSFDGATWDAFARQYTSAGGLGWTREFGTGPGTTTDSVLVAVDGSGNVDIGGTTNGTLPGKTNLGSADGFVRQYNSSGTAVWTDQFGTAGADEVGMVAVDASGNLYATGRLADYTRTLVRQWSSSGTPGWSRDFGVEPWVAGDGIAVDTSNHVYVTGPLGGAFPGYASAGGDDGYLMKFTTSPAQATTTVLAAAPEPSIAGNSVTYTATVTPSTGTLDGGTVTFTEGTTTLCNAVTVDTGTGHASCPVSGSTAGQHVVAATYSGTTSFDLSWGYTIHTVNPATIATTTGLAAAPEPSIIGGSVTYTATVTPVSGSLDGGTVAFNDGTTPITGCSARSVSAGQATCSVTYSTLGSHPISATYSGTTAYAGSTSSSINHMVTYGLDLMTRTTTRPKGTLRVKVALVNASGTDVSASTINLDVTGVTGPSPWGGTATGTMTYVDRRNSYYQYTIAVPSTQASGSYKLQFSVDGDPVTHEIPITIK